MKTELKKLTNLKYENYSFETCDVCHDRFDLYKCIKSEKTGKVTRKLIGYGYTFEEGIEKMIRTNLGEREKITTLKGYVDAYKSAVEEVKNLLK